MAIAPTASAERRTLLVVNLTEDAIDDIRINADTGHELGEDLLGESAIPRHETGSIAFTTAPENCFIDLAVTFGDGNRLRWNDLAICGARKIVIRFHPDRNTTSASVED